VIDAKTNDCKSSMELANQRNQAEEAQLLAELEQQSK